MKKKILRIVTGIVLILSVISNSSYAEENNTLDYLVKYSKLSTGRKYTLDTLLDKYKESMIKAQKSEIAIKLDKVTIKKIQRIEDETNKAINRLSTDKNDMDLRNSQYVLAQHEATQQLVELKKRRDTYIGDKNTEEYKTLEKQVQDTQERLIYLSRLVAQTEEAAKIINNQMVDLIRDKNNQKPDSLFEEELAMFSSKNSEAIRKNVIATNLNKFKGQVLEIIPLMIQKDAMRDRIDRLSITLENHNKALALGFVSEDTVQGVELSLGALQNELDKLNSAIAEKKNQIKILADLNYKSSIQLTIDLSNVKRLRSVNYYHNAFIENSIQYKKLEYTITAYHHLIKNYKKYGKRFIEQAEMAHFKIQEIELRKKEFTNTTKISIQGVLDGIKKIKVQQEGMIATMNNKEKELNKLKLKESLGFINPTEIHQQESDIKELKMNIKILQFQLYMNYKALESIQEGIYLR